MKADRAVILSNTFDCTLPKTTEGKPAIKRAIAKVITIGNNGDIDI